MAEQVIRATATIPAGVTADSPDTFEVTLDNWDIVSIDLEVPPGPAGNMGFFLSNNGQPWIPRVVGEYFVWDDHHQSFAVTDYPSGSGWQITGYNTGSYDHIVIVTFHVNPTTIDVPTAVAPIVLTFVETGVAAPDPVVL